MLALALVALAQVDGGVVDGGPPPPDPLSALYAQCPTVDFADGGTAPFSYPVDGGAPATSDWYVPYPRAQRQACRTAACEERLRQYTDNPPAPFFSKPTLITMFSFAFITLVAGAYLGWEVRALLFR